jgi:MSHA biogenesis protein MshQ
MGVQAPAGWTLIRRTDGNTDQHGTATSLFVYQKVALAGDVGGSYTFNTAGGTNGVGGIAAYRNVDAGIPIDAENGAATGGPGNFLTTHPTPSIDTTVPNTRLVASFSVSNARAWTTATGGMTERVEVFQPTGGNNTGVSLAMDDVAQAAIATVGPFSANTSNQTDAGATHLLALRPRCVLPITKPGTVASGDVMVASLSVRNMTATVAAVPAGWTLLARTDNNTVNNTVSMLIYYKAYAGEAGPYQWIFDSCDYAAGGIQAFGGVDTTAGLTINASGGLANASGLTQTAPSITPTVANTMLVSVFAIRSGATWTRGSAAMTEDYDVGIPTPPAQVGLSIATYHESWATASATGTRTATASNDADTGIGFMLALRPTVVVVIPSGFNAYDSTTAAGATAGNIRTRVSGVATSLDVIALKTGPAIETAFTGTVRVEVLNASDNSGAFIGSTGCRSSWTVIQTLADPTFVAGDNGRKTVSFTQNNSYRDARIRVTYPAGAPTVTGCSNDDFAIRPASFAVAITDATWSTAGAGRALANTGAAGGNVHKAGQPFTITVTPSPGTAALYDGSPTVSALACVLPGTCTPAMLAPGTFTGAGTRVSSNATYSEAGAFNLTLVDQTYASVDAADGTPADCSASGQYVCQSSAPLAVGRFVPDHFAVTAITQPVFRTFDATDASCSVPPSGPRRSFTYIGQFFGYQTSPAAMITAQNAANATTTNYRGALWKLTNASAAQSFANTPVMTLDLTQIGTPVLAETPNTGTGTLTANAADKLAFQRDNAVPQAQFTANLALTWSVSDANEAGANQGTITTATALVFNGSGAGIAFDSGAQFRYGRLQIGNANGSQLLPLAVPLETQYWNGSTFATNTADNCTTLAATNIGLGNYAGNLNSGETAPTLSGAFSAGKKALSLSAPGAGNNGSVDLVVNLGSTIDSCTAFAAPPPAPAGANQPWLRGRWCGATQSKDTTGRATFGVYLGSEEVIFLRENF